MNSWSMYCLTRLDFPTVLFPTTAILRSLLHSMLMLYSLSFVISFCIFCFLKLLYLKKGIFVVCRCAIEGRFCSFSKKKMRAARSRDVFRDEWEEELPSEEFNLPVRMGQRGSPAPHAATQQHGPSATARTPLGAHDSELVTAGHVVAHYGTTPPTAPTCVKH